MKTAKRETARPSPKNKPPSSRTTKHKDQETPREEATKKEKSRYNQMRKKLDFSWTPTLKLVINGKFVDQYTFLDEDYYSLPSKKQKEKKQDYIDKLSSWLNQIYQD